ncbi:hypothetical protein HOLleu_26082 [Holothuria leucospilota]|uniref:Spaetzle domain-containing protein n=1 Tax=Holothuria leucospilota TaxID=206669 RepID=A0A9Q1BTH3_HOLLE|nr:hypothetical protein HOLleu_26082 [Holothuria leucospilota]
MSTTSQWILFLFLFCVFVLPLSATSLRRAFPVDLSSFTDQEIYKIDSEVDAKQESFEPYETSLYPVYQQLVDGPTIYDVLNSPAIEQVKSRKDAFSVDEPAFRPRYDSITHISDRHDEQRMNVYKRTNLNGIIGRSACRSISIFQRPDYLVDEHGQQVTIEPQKYFWVTECDTEPGADCLGIGPAYGSNLSSDCEQKYSWINVRGRRHDILGDYWVSIKSCCSCAVKGAVAE